MIYEALISEYEEEVEIIEMDITVKGLYADNFIAINKRIETKTEKACILAEEIGHHETSYGDILDQTNECNIKQEKRAMKWAFDELIKMDGIIAAYNAGCRNRFELAEYLGVPEYFLEEAIKHCKEKYGLFYRTDDHVICFDPLGVMKEI